MSAPTDTDEGIALAKLGADVCEALKLPHMWALAFDDGTLYMADVDEWSIMRERGVALLLFHDEHAAARYAAAEWLDGAPHPVPFYMAAKL